MDCDKNIELFVEYILNQLHLSTLWPKKYLLANASRRL